MKRRSGFTLVEIMIVVAILGLLAAMGTYAINKSMTIKREKMAETELQLLATAILQLAWDTGRWPNGAWRQEGASGDNELSTLEGSGIDSEGTAGLYEGWKGPYYEGSYTDPWGKPYFFDSDYTYAGQVRVVVGSSGPNRSGVNSYDSDNIVVPLDD